MKSIIVNYDRDWNTLDVEIDGNTISVTVKGNEETRSYYQNSTKSFDKDIKKESLTKTYDKVSKTMKVSFCLEGEEKDRNSLWDMISQVASRVKEVAPLRKELLRHRYDEFKKNRVEELRNKAEALHDKKREEQKKKAISLRENGWSYRRIAREVGVSDKTVARWTTNSDESC